MRFAVVLLAAAAFPAAAHAGALSGEVIDARGLPVAGIEVVLGEGERTVRTDAEGRYAFADVAAGEASIAVRQANGDVQRAFAMVAEDSTTRRDIYLVSARALSAAFGAREPQVDADIAEAMRLAEQMTAEADRRTASAWRWNDREA